MYYWSKQQTHWCYNEKIARENYDLHLLDSICHFSMQATSQQISLLTDLMIFRNGFHPFHLFIEWKLYHFYIKFLALLFKLLIKFNFYCKKWFNFSVLQMSKDEIRNAATPAPIAVLEMTAKLVVWWWKIRIECWHPDSVRNITTSDLGKRFQAMCTIFLYIGHTVWIYRLNFLIWEKWYPGCFSYSINLANWNGIRAINKNFYG